MSLADVKHKVDLIGEKLAVISTDLNRLDFAINNVENPDDSAILAEIFSQKVTEFVKLQEQFRLVLCEYEELSKENKNVLSFTAQKLLKAIS